MNNVSIWRIPAISRSEMKLNDFFLLLCVKIVITIRRNWKWTKKRRKKLDLNLIIIGLNLLMLKIDTEFQIIILSQYLLSSLQLKQKSGNKKNLQNLWKKLLQNNIRILQIFQIFNKKKINSDCNFFNNFHFNKKKIKTK